MDVGTPLSKMMAKKGISAYDLAFRTQIRLTQIYQYRRGLARPGAVNGAKIADALHCKTDELWPGVQLRK